MASTVQYQLVTDCSNGSRRLPSSFNLQFSRFIAMPAADCAKAFGIRRVRSLIIMEIL
ncbi:MAG: hypothetical protein V7K67_08960 [Nostoc sp.]|uniref:hypothetical protein n=1 Tax=Nostoc sp. TaxID=1180 RepID=UPI002FF78BD3